MEDKREIKSEAELVNAICKGIEVYDKTEDQILHIHNFEFGGLEYFDEYEMLYEYPIKVVELYKNPYADGFYLAKNKSSYSTHKQTQIIQNGEVIWTETEKIK